MGGLISFFKEVKSHITRRRINNDAVYEALLKEEYKKQNIILKNQIDELEVKQHMMEASLVLRKQTKTHLKLKLVNKNKTKSQLTIKQKLKPKNQSAKN